MSSPAVTVLSDPDQVVGTLSPFRRRILETMTVPGWAIEIARLLGTTRQRVNYHLRALEEAGLVQLHEERPRRGLTERVMRRSAEIVLVDPSAFDTSGPSRRDVAGVSGVVSIATDLIRQAVAVSARAGASGKRVPAIWDDTERELAESPDVTNGMYPILVDPPHSRLFGTRDRTLLIDVEGSGEHQVLCIQASTHGEPEEWRKQAIGLGESALTDQA